jgi:hypothetical protein
MSTGSPFTLRQSPKNRIRSSAAGGGSSPKMRSSPCGMTATARGDQCSSSSLRLRSPWTKTMS